MGRRAAWGVGLVLLGGAGLVASSGVVSSSNRGGMEGRTAQNGGASDGGKPGITKLRKVSTNAQPGGGQNKDQQPNQHGDSRRAKKSLTQPKYRTLQRLLQDLEESDYAGIGAWGSFSTNQRRRVSRSFNGNSESDSPEQSQQPPQQQPPQQQPPQPPQQQSSQQRQQQSPLPNNNAQQGGQTVSMQAPGVNDHHPGEWADGYGYSAQQQAQMEGYWGPSDLQDGSGPPLPVPFYRGLDSGQQLMAYGASGEYMEEGDFDQSHIISLRSVLKIGVMLLVSMVMSYLAVVPRTAPTHLYNYLFKINMLMLAAAFAAPMLLMVIMYNPREINVNNMVHMFFSAFTWGYVLSFVMEVASATGIKLVLFKWFDSGIFEANPEVPALYLPWLWKDKSPDYRPRLVTLLTSDVLINCIACPLIEEGVKLLVWRACTRKIQQQRQAERRYVPERHPPNVHSLLVHLVVVSMGLKVADNNRRILLYTRPEQPSKPFFALARGVFPVHELCGAFTALNLVRRDILGETIPLWRLLAPAVVLHSMANFRGMKPFFKWSSSAPWTEMQLQALSAPDYATALQQIWKAAWGLVWFAVLARVLGYLMYSHYVLQKLVRRQQQHHRGYPPGAGFQ